MKNAILPPVSSQLYIYGNNEAISDHVPVQMDSKLNVYVNNFCMDSEVLYNNEGQLGVGGIGFPFQSPIDYQPGPSSSMTIKRLDCPCLVEAYPTTTSNYDTIHDQQPLSFSKRLSVPQLEPDARAKQSSRKRPIDICDDLVPEMRFNNLVDNKQPALNEWATNKKKPLCLEKQWQGQVEEEQRHIQRPRSVPVRRSQKLSDRITALQKLVSPYGKTDTASVLQEASISVKILQDQIQNLIQKLTTSYISTKTPYSQETGEKQLDLRSRGLCLVPVSFTQKLTKE